MNDMVRAEPSATMIAFTKAVKLRMDRAGVTKLELSRLTGIEPSTLRRILNLRGGNANIATMDQIAEALGTSVIALLNWAARAERVA